MNPKRYVASFFLLLSLIATGVLLSNIVIDSHGIFKLIKIEKINAQKTISNGLGRYAVGANLYLHDYEVIFAGTSRVQSGMDPRMPSLRGQRVFNASLGDTDAEEITQLLRYTLINQPKLKTLYFGLDFHPFSSYRELHPEYDKAAYNPENSVFSVLAKEIFSKRGIGDSLRTLKKNLQGNNQKTWYEGHYHSEAPIDYKKNIENILNYYMAKKVMFGCFHYNENEVRELQKVLTDYVKAGIELKLFISPQHAKNLMMLEYADLFDEYFTWMRDMSKMAQELKAIDSDKVVLWNFSGFNFVTTEPVSYDFTPMEYYFETSHYKDNVGELIVEVLNTDSNIKDFGDKIDNNIEYVIDKIKANKKDYVERERNEIMDLERLYHATADERSTLVCELN